MNGTFHLQQVTIRMYRPGLGDCFLLTFKDSGGDNRTLLIDCGVLQKTPGQEERLGKIIGDIKQQTGGSATARGRLDVVVATHEHNDHLSGFVLHHDLFKRGFTVQEVWLPWTEDKQDPHVAETYSAVCQLPLEALREALQQYGGRPDSEIPASIRNIKKLYEFVSDGGMDSLRSLGNTVSYLRPEPDTEKSPTRVIVRDDFGGVCFHVLAPPEDPQGLTQNDLPRSKNQVSRGAAVNAATALTAALLARRTGRRAAADSLTEEDVLELFKACLPFDQSRMIPLDKTKKERFFIERYGFDDREGAEAPAWRRIEEDWLEAGTELALKLDGYTNNTSLVLAIELSAGGKVLLFPGDAQHSSWLTWAKTPKGTDLLRRTVFYKVGHHGSNNATLVPGGLDKMTSPDLVAMIPVDPVRQQNFHMPDGALKSRLLARARGRVIQACEGAQPEEVCPCVDFRPPNQKPVGMTAARWKKFLQSIRWDPSPDRLWVEYTLTV
jgi:hypothetical protein